MRGFLFFILLLVSISGSIEASGKIRDCFGLLSSFFKAQRHEFLTPLVDISDRLRNIEARLHFEMSEEEFLRDRNELKRLEDMMEIAINEGVILLGLDYNKTFTSDFGYLFRIGSGEQTPFWVEEHLLPQVKVSLNFHYLRRSHGLGRATYEDGVFIRPSEFFDSILARSDTLAHENFHMRGNKDPNDLPSKISWKHKSSVYLYQDGFRFDELEAQLRTARFYFERMKAIKNAQEYVFTFDDASLDFLQFSSSFRIASELLKEIKKILIIDSDLTYPILKDHQVDYLYDVWLVEMQRIAYELANEYTQYKK